VPDLSFAADLLNATLFLYPSVEDAEKGVRAGGSGVAVSVPLSRRPDLAMTYFVTNWHVACSGGHSVVRYTDLKGATRIIEMDPSDWYFVPGGSDLAIIGAQWLDEDEGKSVPISVFVSEAENEVFIGEDVFMVGRFVDFDGHLSNKPALRFGAISMMDAPIRQPTNSRSPSVIVDMHSRSGFSGSPVYAYRPAGTTVNGMHVGTGLFNGGPDRPLVSGRTWGNGTQTQIRLLGVLWGQFPETWEIKSPPIRASAEAALVQDGSAITGFSGMSCVIPASEIAAILNSPRFVAGREEIPQEYLDSIPVAENTNASEQP
jgi:hypothetical protein